MEESAEGVASKLRSGQPAGDSSVNEERERKALQTEGNADGKKAGRTGESLVLGGS